MKKYIAPEINITLLKTEDVLYGSVVTYDYGNGDWWEHDFFYGY